MERRTNGLVISQARRPTEAPYSLLVKPGRGSPKRLFEHTLYFLAKCLPLVLGFLPGCTVLTLIVDSVEGKSPPITKVKNRKCCMRWKPEVYLSWLETLLNVLFSDVPIEFTAATITIEVPAAMRAYSIAVAPV